ncbi:hypothetical protein AYI68_g3344 [Smittium mucronatum]|uniref:Uncharacterized protein n=1 Tax=Smittium mucronatum TaxID=133383 RepID=A0A1R0H085_9FUNG|nr:hypothetical protein AYI68_g3344 [Smittium mucronatum]
MESAKNIIERKVSCLEEDAGSSPNPSMDGYAKSFDSGISKFGELEIRKDNRISVRLGGETSSNSGYLPDEDSFGPENHGQPLPFPNPQYGSGPYPASKQSRLDLNKTRGARKSRSFENMDGDFGGGGVESKRRFRFLGQVGESAGPELRAPNPYKRKSFVSIKKSRIPSVKNSRKSLHDSVMSHRMSKNPHVILSSPSSGDKFNEGRRGEGCVSDDEVVYKWDSWTNILKNFRFKIATSSRKNAQNLYEDFGFMKPRTDSTDTSGGKGRSSYNDFDMQSDFNHEIIENRGNELDRGLDLSLNENGSFSIDSLSRAGSLENYDISLEDKDYTVKTNERVPVTGMVETQAGLNGFRNELSTHKDKIEVSRIDQYKDGYNHKKFKVGMDGQRPTFNLLNTGPIDVLSRPSSRYKPTLPSFSEFMDFTLSINEESKEIEMTTGPDGNYYADLVGGFGEHDMDKNQGFDIEKQTTSLLQTRNELDGRVPDEDPQEYISANTRIEKNFNNGHGLNKVRFGEEQLGLNLRNLSNKTSTVPTPKIQKNYHSEIGLGIGKEPELYNCVNSTPLSKNHKTGILLKNNLETKFAQVNSTPLNVPECSIKYKIDDSYIFTTSCSVRDILGNKGGRGFFGDHNKTNTRFKKYEPNAIFQMDPNLAEITKNLMKYIQKKSNGTSSAAAFDDGGFKGGCRGMVTSDLNFRFEGELKANSRLNVTDLGNHKRNSGQVVGIGRDYGIDPVLAQMGRKDRTSARFILLTPVNTSSKHRIIAVIDSPAGKNVSCKVQYLNGEYVYFGESVSVYNRKKGIFKDESFPKNKSKMSIRFLTEVGGGDKNKILGGIEEGHQFMHPTVDGPTRSVGTVRVENAVMDSVKNNCISNEELFGKLVELGTELGYSIKGVMENGTSNVYFLGKIIEKETRSKTKGPEQLSWILPETDDKCSVQLVLDNGNERDIVGYCEIKWIYLALDFKHGCAQYSSTVLVFISNKLIPNTHFAKFENMDLTEYNEICTSMLKNERLFAYYYPMPVMFCELSGGNNYRDVVLFKERVLAKHVYIKVIGHEYMNVLGESEDEDMVFKASVVGRDYAILPEVRVGGSVVPAALSA